MARRNRCTLLLALLLLGCFLKADELKRMMVKWYENKIQGLVVSKEPHQTETTRKYVSHVSAYASEQLSDDPEKDYMQERVRYKAGQCKRLKRDGSLNYATFGPLNILYSREYNVSYCNVGKSGSTFMKQFFAVLGNRASALKNIESMSRSQIQRSHRSRVNNFSGNWEKTRLMTVVRNPYTRLFSSYLDKVMLPSINYVNVTGSCQLDDTFGEYLEYILNTKKKTDLYSPIYDLCKVCDFTSTYIVKLETFTNDITYVLNDINLAGDPKRLLVRNMNKTRDIWSITGFVKEVMEKVKERPQPFLKPGCVGWLGIIRKLWTALQFQGYVHQNATLPLHLYNDTNDYSNTTAFLEFVFTARAMHPLAKDEANDQRQRSLKRAYSQINKELIERIKEVYGPDFEIFKYSTDPPQ